MHETWDPAAVRRDMAQEALHSLERQAEGMRREREMNSALLRLSWICAACGWALFALKAAGAF